MPLIEDRDSEALRSYRYLDDGMKAEIIADVEAELVEWLWEWLEAEPSDVLFKVGFWLVSFEVRREHLRPVWRVLFGERPDQ